MSFGGSFVALTAEPPTSTHISDLKSLSVLQSQVTTTDDDDDVPRSYPEANLLETASQSGESDTSLRIPESQRALLLHGVRQPYQLTSGHPVPEARHDHELLVRNETIGLNPIDWKSP